MYKNILLCYDGSRDGSHALLEGASLARLCKSEVILLAVVDDAHGLAFGEAAATGAIEHQRSDLEEVLKAGARKLESMGLSPRMRLEQGDPVELIIAAAKETNADLTVIGHHHHSRLTRWLTRSVAVDLADRLDCSLLLARVFAGQEQQW